MNTHFIGIGGIGMSALARILLQQRKRVSGSDLAPSPVTDELGKLGAQIFIGHAKENIPDGSQVVYSTDILPTNPEWVHAKTLGLHLIHRSELLKKLMEKHSPLLVAGAHGKTTTSSLLAHVLHSCGTHPSFAVGGIVHSLGSNGGYGKGPYFVAEADESDGSFLKYSGYGGILTNIDNDHLDYWKNEAAILNGFKQFSNQISSKDHLFWCKDDHSLNSLNLEGLSYGFGEKADLHVSSYQQRGWKNYFDINFMGKSYADIELPLIGGYNVLNAASVFGLALTLGLKEEAIRRALSTFVGVGRRVEKKGEIGTITIYDDYAHHPTEIFATLRAIKNAVGTRRLVVVFQPHRYTRTRDCIDQFPQAFDEADILLLTDIYSAREQPIPGITTEFLLSKIQEKYAREVFYSPRDQLVKTVASQLKNDDVLVTMGAGDVTKVGSEVIDWLRNSQ